MMLVPAANHQASPPAVENTEVGRPNNSKIYTHPKNQIDFLLGQTTKLLPKN